MDQHTADLWNVNEGDELHIYTSEGENFSATCTSRERQHADERTGEVRRTTIWVFDTAKGELAATILQGLRSSEDDGEFPQHSQLWAMEREEGLGYIEDIRLAGQPPEA